MNLFLKQKWMGRLQRWKKAGEETGVWKGIEALGLGIAVLNAEIQQRLGGKIPTSSFKTLFQGKKGWGAVAAALLGIAACGIAFQREEPEDSLFKLKTCSGKLSRKDDEAAFQFESDAMGLLRTMRDQSAQRDVTPEYERLNAAFTRAQHASPSCALRNQAERVEQILVEEIPLRSLHQAALLAFARQRSAHPNLVLGGWLIQGLSHTSGNVCLPPEIKEAFRKADLNHIIFVNEEPHTVLELASSIQRTQACPIRPLQKPEQTAPASPHIKAFATAIP